MVRGNRANKGRWIAALRHGHVGDPHISGTAKPKALRLDSLGLFPDRRDRSRPHQDSQSPNIDETLKFTVVSEERDTLTGLH